MQVSIDDDLLGRVRAVWAVLDGLAHAEHPEFSGELTAAQEALRAEHAGRKPSEIPALSAARRLYRSVGMEPTRYRPSSEALMRRVLRGQGIYRIDPLVDTGNLFSLVRSMPLGLYDAATIEGDVRLRLGQVGESYPGIRKGKVNVAGRLCLADDEGAFGSPSSDSARCRIRESTVGIVFLIYAPGDFPEELLLAAGDEMLGMFRRWNSLSSASWQADEHGRVEIHSLGF